jgi:hypothetical protein
MFILAWARELQSNIMDVTVSIFVTDLVCSAQDDHMDREQAQ